MNTIPVPLIDRSFYAAGQRQGLREALESIGRRFGDQTATAAALSDVREEIIRSVIFIESGGDAKAISPQGALGLMQLKTTSAEDCLFLAKKNGLLTPGLSQALDKALGGKLAQILNRPNLGVPPRARISTAQLLDPWASILIGTTYLALLIRQHTEAGVIRLDKVIARYNRGYFFKPKDQRPEQLLATVPAETRAYILKLVGVNSTLDVLAATA